MPGPPAELTSFVGRRQLLAEARRLLSAGRLVTMTGSGGVGKTRIALRLAEQVRRAFTDGTYVAELGTVRDPSLLAQAVSSVLGLPEAETGARLVRHLRDKHLLLILDGCEHLVDECAAFLGRLLPTATGVRVIVTSRHVLGIAGEQVLPIPPFPLPESGRRTEPDALTLFGERARAVVPGFRIDDSNVEDVTAVCRALDGLPLAVELATAWLRVLSVRDLRSRMDDYFTLLTRGNRNAPPRQRTLLATIDWSYDLCSPEERLLWTRVSAFADDFDLAAAEAVCADHELPHDDVLHLMANLVDKSILGVGDDGPRTRYRMLATLRRYGRNKLRQRGTEAEHVMLRRHRDYYVGLALRLEGEWLAGAEQCSTGDETRRAYGNLRAALHYCFETPGQERLGLLLATTLHFFWLHCGFLGDGRYWLDRALDRNPEPGRLRAKALWIGSYAASATGDAERGTAMAYESMEWPRRAGGASLDGHGLLALGVATLVTGDLSACRALCDSAAGRLRSPEEATHALTARALQYVAMSIAGDADQAAELVRASLHRDDRRGRRWTSTRLLFALAFAEWSRGDDAAARRTAERALRGSCVFNDALGAASTIELLAWIAERAGDHRRAAMLLGVGERVWPLAGGPRLLGSPIGNALHQACHRRTRDALGARAFDGAVRRGGEHGRDLTTAVAQALGEGGVEPSDVPGARTDDLLTRRELEVAGLVAQGLSNKELAERLLVTVRTAETHVNHVLGKLGFTSRSQIAAWYLERGQRG